MHGVNIEDFFVQLVERLGPLDREPYIEREISGSVTITEKALDSRNLAEPSCVPALQLLSPFGQVLDRTFLQTSLTVLQEVKNDRLIYQLGRLGSA